MDESLTGGRISGVKFHISSLFLRLLLFLSLGLLRVFRLCTPDHGLLSGLPSPPSLIVSCYTLSAKVQVCAISQLIVQEEQIKNLAREQREVTEDLAQLRPYNKHRGNRLRRQAGQAKPGVERLIRKYKTGSITKPAVYPCRQNVDDRLQCVGGDSDAKSTTRFRGAG